MKVVCHFYILPLKERVCLPLGFFPLFIGWYVDMMAGAAAAFLTTGGKQSVEHGRATR